MMEERELLNALMEENERQDAALELREVQSQVKLDQQLQESQANNRRLASQHAEIAFLAAELDKMNEKLREAAEQLDTLTEGKV